MRVVVVSYSLQTSPPSPPEKPSEVVLGLGRVRVFLEMRRFLSCHGIAFMRGFPSV